MGCDYYTYYKICIQYKNGDTIEIEEEIDEDTRQRHYFYDVKERDPYFEEIPEYLTRIRKEYQNQIENKLRGYVRKDIFKDNKWLCIESSKEKYLNMCKENEIPESAIIAIWKEGDYNYR
jgi:hypothetical protein